ncbi:DUF637 domain-containing protein [Cellvibrio fibrivorans]|uniref:Adhesin HecA-like repeat protein n=1 Tax=Cellvibrio fibrivorans TaxID=126350 RepID=A0ABU1V3M3_9GAMM|nr:DUF637 domain-containing protein [Cellvibrio fibrivorans]MDR7091985.1 adhesin HecA-like repeat protein [Cellvibrio fibrivorans]
MEAYTGAFFIHKNVLDTRNIQSLHDKYPAGLKDATAGQLIGDTFVQTRLIRAQYRAQMGRFFFIGVLQPELMESESIKTLYDNAEVYARNNNYRFGEALNGASVSKDMIWPEKRRIGTADYLVPVVYLSQSTLEKRMTGHLVAFNSNAAFAGIILDFTTLVTGNNSIIEGMRGIINNGATISSPGNLTLKTSGTLANMGGTITADDNIAIYAGDVDNKTLLIPYKDKNGQGTRVGQVASIGAGGNLLIESLSDIEFLGAQGKAGETITLRADNNIVIGPVITEGQSNTQQGHWEINKSTTDLIMSRLAAEDTLSLIAGGVINITASELISTRGGIELLAGEGIHILDELEQTSIQKEDRKGKTKGTSSEFRTEAVRAILSAGKGVLLDSEHGDVVLRATQLTSTSGTEVYARNGKVHLLMTKELEEFHLQTTRKGTWTIKTRTEDIVHENNIQNAILGGLQVQAKYGINVEYTGKEGATLKEQIEEYRKMPEMKWMAELYDQAVVDGGQNVNWEVIEEVHKELKKTKRNLSPAAMAIIAIAVCVAMGPAGAGLIGSGGSISAAVVTAGGNAALGAALSAGAVALTTQAAQSLASGNNLRETISGFDSSDSLKSLAVAMVTAGAMQAAQVDMFQVPEGASVDALNLAKQAGQAVVNSAVSAGVSTVIYGGNSENFLSSFKQGLMTSAVNKIGEKMANKIGSAYKDGDINNVVRYVAHAGAGCVMGIGLAGASNSSNDESLSCFSGAGGAVVGELAADAYKAQKIEDLAKQYEGYASQLRAQGATNATIEAAFQSPEMQDLMNQQMADLKAVGVDLAKLSGAFAALAAGGDVSIAAQTGENAAKNNALFLIPLAIIALKAIDVALTAKELWDIYDTNKNNPEGLSKALAEWLAIEAGGAAVGKVIPGFKTAQEMIDWLRKNDVLSVSMVDGIEKSFKGFKGEQPDSAPNVLNDAPTPDNPLDLTAVGGKASFVKQMTVPNNAIRNDGILGEQVAEQIIGDATGLTFRTTLKNNSNNGVDLIAIDEKTNTIWIIEVKSSINGQFPSVQSQNLVTRSKDWILNASNGSINNQQLDPAEVEYAQKIQDMVKNGWNLKPMYSTVSIPKPNTTGPATVTIQPVI